MEYDEFVRWTAILVALELLTPAQAEDVRIQRRLFDEQRGMLELEFADRVVGFVAEKLVAAEDTISLLDRVVEMHDSQRQLYFEAIGPIDAK